MGEILNDSDVEVGSDGEEEVPLIVNELLGSDNEEGDDDFLPQNADETGEVLYEMDDDIQEEYESASEDDIDAEINLNCDKFVGADGTEWSSRPQPAGQAQRQNIIRQKCGPTHNTSSFSIEETFRSYMCPQMVDIIVRHTNKKAQAVYAAYNERHPLSQMKWKELTFVEFNAFLGVLIMTGLKNSKDEAIRDLWSIRREPLFRAVMGVPCCGSYGLIVLILVQHACVLIKHQYEIFGR